MNRLTRRVSLAVAVSLVAVLGAFSAVAAAAPSTTTPGQVYIVKVTLTDTAIVIPKDKFDLHRKYPRYPRGAAIQYQFKNTTKKPLALRIWDKTTPIIRPGKVEPLLINWNFRGTFVYETLRAGKPLGPKGTVTIF